MFQFDCKFYLFISLEMEEERHYNEIVMSGGNIRNRTVSSPVPYNPSPSSSRPLSPGYYYYNTLVLDKNEFFTFII